MAKKLSEPTQPRSLRDSNKWLRAAEAIARWVSIACAFAGIPLTFYGLRQLLTGEEHSIGFWLATALVVLVIFCACYFAVRSVFRSAELSVEHAEFREKTERAEKRKHNCERCVQRMRDHLSTHLCEFELAQRNAAASSADDFRTGVNDLMGLFLYEVASTLKENYGAETCTVALLLPLKPDHESNNWRYMPLRQRSTDSAQDRDGGPRISIFNHKILRAMLGDGSVDFFELNREPASQHEIFQLVLGPESMYELWKGKEMPYLLKDERPVFGFIHTTLAGWAGGLAEEDISMLQQLAFLAFVPSMIEAGLKYQHSAPATLRA